MVLERQGHGFPLGCAPSVQENSGIHIPKAALNLMCGGVAGAISRTVVSPLERLKILYQVQYVTLQKKSGRGHSTGSPKYGSVMSSLRLIYQEEGFRGYYKGNLANVIR